MDNEQTLAREELAGFYKPLDKLMEQWRARMEDLNAKLAEMERGLAKDAQERAGKRPDILRMQEIIVICGGAFASGPAGPGRKAGVGQAKVPLEGVE